ncbi:MAG: outer membrane lipoprotein LolB [Betaproteobacteria bacterium]|nr:outer membrane lipoprotein LolB [Betaproteobacteria bacterium]
MNPSRRGVLVALALLAAGCAEPPIAPAPVAGARTAPPASFRLEGRVSVKSGEESFSGGIAWRHVPDADEILLTTPLGQGVAELRITPQGANLVDGKGRQHAAPDTASLLRQTLGVELPLQGLVWWALGRPRPDAPAHEEFDAAGQVARMEQDGWRIEFARHARQQGYLLPGRLIARRGEDLEVRLVADAWELP